MSAFSDRAESHGAAGVGELWARFIRLAALLSVPPMVLSIALADGLIRLLYSDQYAPAVGLFQVFMALSVVGRLLGGGAHSTALYALGHNGLACKLRFLSAVANLTLSALLIPPFGPLGALVGTGLSGVIVMLLEAYVAARRTAQRFPWLAQLRLLVATVLPLVPLLVWRPSQLHELTAATLGYGLLLLPALWQARILDPRDREMLRRAAARFVPPLRKHTLAGDLTTS
jgi:O-antigen/teichoic acid export membrane protein